MKRWSINGLGTKEQIGLNMKFQQSNHWFEQKLTQQQANVSAKFAVKKTIEKKKLPRLKSNDEDEES